MLIAHWILLIGGLLPYVIVATAKSTKLYDNADPRLATNYQGWRTRAYAAHSNALEAFPLFAAAVLLATLRGADGTFVDVAAIVWFVARILYWRTYVTGQATARSIVWFVATLASLAIFLAALFF